MILKRDLIENIINQTKDLGISELIRDYMIPTSNSFKNLYSLYQCVATLDNPMLADIPKVITRLTELFIALKKTLYVVGKWEALCDFYIYENYHEIINDCPFSKTIVVSTDSNFICKYTTSSRTITITISDSLLGIVTESSHITVERLGF